MKQKKIINLLIIAIFLVGNLGIGSYLFYLSYSKPSNSAKVISTNPKKTNTPVAVAPDTLYGWKFPVAKLPLTGSDGKLIAYSSIRDPGGIPQGLPVRLRIPGIGVDSAIEDALITPDGRMDVPAGSVNVAWFSLGPHPGAVGSAVIGGHFGIENGVPFVFYKLDQVKVGDKIYIIDDKDNSLAFVVRSIKSFDRNADATTVFTSGDGLAHLNLITCEGTWNQVNGAYPQRLVVFTDAVPSEDTGADKTPALIAATPIPAIAKPVVANQPAAANASPTEIIPTLTIIPTEAVPSQTPEKKPFISSQILIASAQSLYATPLDGLVTALLVGAIAFAVFKIIRR